MTTTEGWLRISPLNATAHWFDAFSKVSRCGHAWRSRGEWPDDQERHCQHCSGVTRRYRAMPALTVDREADAAYVELRPRAGGVARTIELGYGINVDLDEDGVPLGYEILSLHADDGGAS